MQTPEELEADIIRRAFDESFLDEKLLTKLLHAYRDLAVEAERFVVQVASSSDPDQIAYKVVHSFPGSEYWIDTDAAIAAVTAALRAAVLAERERIRKIAQALGLDVSSDKHLSEYERGRLSALVDLLALIGE